MGGRWGEPSCCAPVVAGLIGQCGYSTALSSQRLARKVAVITGAASGIGKATMVEFVRNGAKVVLADVQDDLGRALAAELCADSTSYSRRGVNDEAQVAAVIDLDVACHGKLDIMLNNTVCAAPRAGRACPRGLRRRHSDQQLGVMAGVKHVACAMAPRRTGSIICTASIAAGAASHALRRQWVQT
uniref:Momilactone A synthase n=1 Tax=Aegilops tauschii TaxID=37682 RepID=N1QQ57_AEGTA